VWRRRGVAGGRRVPGGRGVPRRPDVPRPRAGKLEWAVVILLPLGFLLFPFVGWLVAVILLWVSRVWSAREKLIGTLVVPGGLSAVLVFAFVGISSTCTRHGGPGARTVEHCHRNGLPGSVAFALMIAFVIAGVATPVFLARRATAGRSS
jgi:hypothetical protein